MTIKAFRASMTRSSNVGTLVVSSKAGFVQNINEQVANIVEAYEGWIDNIDTQTGQIVLEALEPTFDMSQEIVPVDKGDLHDSGYLEMVTHEGYSTVEMGYGRGGFPDYAIPVHEDLDARHASPTQAKYLQQPLEQDAPNIEDRIRAGFEIAAGFAGVGH